MTTSYNYTGEDRAALRTAINTQLSAAYMQANVSSNWRGWREAEGGETLVLGAVGGINSQACGAMWAIQQTRPPYPVGDVEAAWARDYALIIYLRRQADPTDVTIVDAFDATVKNRLKTALPSGGDFYDISAKWDVQEIGDSWIETAHMLRFRAVS